VGIAGDGRFGGWRKFCHGDIVFVHTECAVGVRVSGVKIQRSTLAASSALIKPSPSVSTSSKVKGVAAKTQATSQQQNKGAHDESPRRAWSDIVGLARRKMFVCQYGFTEDGGGVVYYANYLKFRSAPAPSGCAPQRRCTFIRGANAEHGLPSGPGSTICWIEPDRGSRLTRIRHSVVRRLSQAHVSMPAGCLMREIVGDRFVVLEPDH
jgi:hypothetical protein